MRQFSKAIIPVAALLAMAASGAAADVTVIRGSVARIVATDRADTAPTVLRGGGSVILPVSSPEPQAARAGGLQITAGRTLWLVDQNTRRITACTLRGTATIDRRRIRCTRY